jgi:hypothetical protein
MRRSFHAPTGNTYAGPRRPSNLALPARGEKWPSAVARVVVLLVLRLVWERWLVGFDAAHGTDRAAAVSLALKLALVVGLGVHACYRYTLMAPPDDRRNALLAFLLVGLPVSLLWESAYLLLLVAPVAAWRAVVSWLTYPENPAPGLFRSPLGPPWVRFLLTLGCDLPAAAAAFVPATFFTRTGHADADPTSDR